VANSALVVCNRSILLRLSATSGNISLLHHCPPNQEAAFRLRRPRGGEYFGDLSTGARLAASMGSGR